MFEKYISLENSSIIHEKKTKAIYYHEGGLENYNVIILVIIKFGEILL